MSLESTSSRIEQLGRQMLIFGRPIPTSELIEKVEAIDGEAVCRVASRTLAGDLTLAAVGKCAGLPEFDELSGLFKV